MALSYWLDCLGTILTSGVEVQTTCQNPKRPLSTVSTLLAGKTRAKASSGNWLVKAQTRVTSRCLNVMVCAVSAGPYTKTSLPGIFNNTPLIALALSLVDSHASVDSCLVDWLTESDGMSSTLYYSHTRGESCSATATTSHS